MYIKLHVLVSIVLEDLVSAYLVVLPALRFNMGGWYSNKMLRPSGICGRPNAALVGQAFRLAVGHWLFHLPSS